jgi:hypothetical protein
MILQAGLGCDQLRGERAITSLDKPFTPSPRSTERVARQYPIGPPPGFRPASPCPGQDRLASRVTGVTSRAIHTSPLTLTSCGLVGFPSFTAYCLILATPMNSLVRVSRRMKLIRSTQVLHRDHSLFVPQVSTLLISLLCIDCWFQVLFTPLPRHFSTFARAT